MTLIDYAKYLLNVCGRRFTHLYRRHYLDSTPALPSLSALLSYLKTQTATIYGYLQTRFAGDPTSGIPSITPTSPLTFANLLPNLQKLATRKIDAGASTQIPEGISLVRLLCDTTSAASLVTELVDTNTNWTWNRSISFGTLFPNVTKLTLYCHDVTFYGTLANLPNLQELNMPNALLKDNAGQWQDGLIRWTGDRQTMNVTIKECDITSGMNNCVFFYNSNADVLNFNIEKLWTNWHTYILQNCIVKKLNMSHLKSIGSHRQQGYHNIHIVAGQTTADNLEEIVFGTLTDFTYIYYSDGSLTSPKLLKIEFGDGTNCSIGLSWWSPTLTDTNRATFLTNFRQYLFLRLADRTSTTALTLTLSSAVFKVVNGYDDNDQTDPTSFAETHTLADLGVTELTAKEQSIGSITLQTKYSRWFRTYRDAIHWNTNKA